MPMNLPTDEQIERACQVAAAKVERDWPEDFSQDERKVYRAQIGVWLAISMNRDFIERGIGGNVDYGTIVMDCIGGPKHGKRVTITKDGAQEESESVCAFPQCTCSPDNTCLSEAQKRIRCMEYAAMEGVEPDYAAYKTTPPTSNG